MIEGKKISELNPASVINDACCFPILSKGATKKISFAVLIENIISNLQLPETQEIKKLKEDVERMNVSVDLTDKQVQSVINQVTGLQKDVDSQDDIIIKYTRIVEELKELYEQATISGGLVDDKLDSESTNPVQNKVISKLIPAQASEENKLADKNYVDNVDNELDVKINDIKKLIPEQASEENKLADKDYVDNVDNRVIELTKLIPEQTTEENKLADKDFVNSSIATNTAEFIGTFNSLEELQNTDKSFDNNDYGFVIETDENGNSSYNRYKYNGSEWVFEYTLNNSSFTSEQWKTINSNVTEKWKNEADEKLSQISSPINDSVTTTDKTWSSDKIGKEIEARKITIDDSINSTSTNPVQNKVVYKEINGRKSYERWINKKIVDIFHVESANVPVFIEIPTNNLDCDFKFIQSFSGGSNDKVNTFINYFSNLESPSQKSMLKVTIVKIGYYSNRTRQLFSDIELKSYVAYVYPVVDNSKTISTTKLQGNIGTTKKLYKAYSTVIHDDLNFSNFHFCISDESPYGNLYFGVNLNVTTFNESIFNIIVEEV